MACIATARMRTGAASRLCPIFSALRKFVSSLAQAATALLDVRLFTPCVLELCKFPIERAEGRLVTSYVSEPAGAASAPRSGAGGRTPVQARNRAARPQSHR